MEGHVEKNEVSWVRSGIFTCTDFGVCGLCFFVG